MSTTLLGFIGLGNVGEPMAANLLAKDFDVLGYDIRANANFVARGGRAVAQVAHVAAAPVIIQSLPTVAALEATIEALLPVLRPRQVIIEISSYPLAAKRAAAERVAERGAILLDCEISGLPPQVAERKAVIFKSGDARAVDELHGVFEAMAEQHFYLGEFGAATKMKLIANTMVCVHNLMAAEALTLGARAGLDPRRMVEVLVPSAAGSATFANKAPLMLARSFRPGRGPFRHMFGYLARAREMARECGASTPLLHAASEVYRRAESEGRHEEDIAAVLEIVEAYDSERRRGDD
ncbi:NAD(P)-dependent oxidoreductase [Pendulispora rubella]|uniref:NAD(P)-dependent oxidoreductase n=1 Tax=Pendulispora rubella TaxID=2741070 RepID=A0ABZ2LF54_9BACT